MRHRSYSIHVKRGELYACKARRGYVTVKVTDVHEPGPWVTVRRVGTRAKGRFTDGPLAPCRRDQSFTVYLTNNGDGTNRMRMPRGYDRVNNKEK